MMQNNNFDRVIDALAFAAEHHRFQRRAGYDKLPYINHLIKVTRLLLETGSGSDPDVVVAGALHDIIEDTEVSHADLAGRYGVRTADIVVELTDDMSLPYAERKQLQVDRAHLLSPAARQIRIADKICNLEDIFTYPLDWPTAKKQAYLENAVQVVARIRGVSASLEDRFDRTVEEIRRKQKHSERNE